MKRWWLVLLFPVLMLCPLLALGRYCWAVVTNPVRARDIALGFDRLVNAALNGDVRHTISYRAAVAEKEGRRWGCVLCRMLDKLDRDHCSKSLEANQ